MRFAARDMRNGSNRDGAVLRRDKARRTAERRVIFFSSVAEFTRQQGEHGCNPRSRPRRASTFVPMKVLLLLDWMVGDDAAAIKQCWDYFDELVLIALGQQKSEKQ